MNMLNEYIKKRKQDTDKTNEAEHVALLNLITIDKPLLEDYTKFIKKRIKDLF